MHDYITDRWMPEMIQRYCEGKGISVEAFSGQWILTLKKGDISRMIFGFKFGGLNDSAASAVSLDKSATYEILHRAGVAAVPHVLISTRAGGYEGWESDAKKWQRFVIKPTQGGGGRAVYAFDDMAQAQKLMQAHHEQSWCASPFLSIKKEVRLILLDDTVLLAFEKRNPAVVHGVPMYNLRLGAMAADINPNEDIIAIARAARQAVGLRLVAVDIVMLKNGESLVLEANEGFSLEHYMRQSKENKLHAEALYGKIIDVMMQPDR